MGRLTPAVVEVGSMINYRIYRTAEDGRFVGVHEISALSDGDAMLQARQLLVS
jgi:hypothetical protein